MTYIHGMNGGLKSTKNFHVPLPGDLYERLREEADRSGMPATSVVREAVEVYLTESEREAARREIAIYAAAMAGTRDDLDEDLEAAAIEFLLEEEPWE